MAGGALAGYSPFAVAFVAIACLGAAIAFAAEPAIAVGAAGSAALVISVLALGAPVPGEVIAEGAFSAVAALMIGASRRQYLARTYQAEQLLAERVRADAERDRAAALAERNRLGREIHDVLAHSLGALSVTTRPPTPSWGPARTGTRPVAWWKRRVGWRSRGWRRPAPRSMR